jgi:hypothetical protein
MSTRLERIAAADLGPHDDRHVRELCLPTGWKAERVFDGDLSIYVLRGQRSEIESGEFCQMEIHIEPVGIRCYTVASYDKLVDGDGNDLKRPWSPVRYDVVEPGELQDTCRQIWDGTWAI